MKRIPTGIALALATLMVVKWAPAVVFWCTLVLVAVLAVEELRRILGLLQRPPWPILAHVGTLATLGAFLLPGTPVAAMLAGILVLIFVRALVPTQQPAEGLDRVVGTLLPILYIGLSLGHLAGVFTPGQTPAARDRGEDLMVLTLCAVYIGDTFALCGGRLFGRHKLAPGISPKKTWEGAVCGVLGAVASGWVAHLWFFQALPLTHALALGGILGVAAILGDLAESLLKRAATLKDSGALFPGHGGMLDRIDSLLLAAPVLYWYHRIFPGG